MRRLRFQEIQVAEDCRKRIDRIQRLLGRLVDRPVDPTLELLICNEGNREGFTLDAYLANPLRVMVSALQDEEAKLMDKLREMGVDVDG